MNISKLLAVASAFFHLCFVLGLDTEPLAAMVALCLTLINLYK
jgi:hypothetical protein